MKKILNKKYINIIGHIFVLISLLIIVHIFVVNFNKLQNITINFKVIITIFFLIMIGVINYLLLSYAWLSLLRVRYEKFKYIDSFRIFILSQIGKYLPGNVGHFIGRYYLAKDYISKQDIAFTIFVENIAIMFISIFVGLYYIKFLDIQKLIRQHGNFIYIAIFAFFIFVAIFLIMMLRNKINILELRFLVLLRVFLIYSLLFFISGFIIYALINTFLPSLNRVGYIQCVSGYSISFLLGFIMPGAPGGIGIREYIFVLLFSPFLGEVQALQIILLYRFITVCTDLFVFGIGKILSRRNNDQS